MYSNAYNLWTFTWFVHFELPFRLKGTEKIHTERFFKFQSNIYYILYVHNKDNIFCTVQTVYIFYCTEHVHIILWTVFIILFSVHFQQYNVHIILYRACTYYTVNCIYYTIQFTYKSTVQGIYSTVQCTFFYRLYILLYSIHILSYRAFS